MMTRQQFYAKIERDPALAYAILEIDAIEDGRERSQRAGLIAIAFFSDTFAEALTARDILAFLRDRTPAEDAILAGDRPKTLIA